jgi:hypothetical protein
VRNDTPITAPALLAGLGGHRGADPDPGAGDLPLGLQAQRHHRLLVIFGAEVDPADHNRVPAPLGVGQFGDQRGGLRAARPRQRPALADIEELRDDPPVPSDQRPGLVPLPGL